MTILPEWTRVAWINRDTRAWWEAVCHDWADLWTTLETESVAAGLRAAAIRHCRPQDLPALAHWAASIGLMAVPITTVADTPTYSATYTAPVPGQSWQYRVIVAAPDVMPDAMRAYTTQDHDRLGALLGYPPCCRATFASTWGRGQVDSTLEAGADGPPETNLWLRWIGVRLVPHLPCRQDCSASLALARQLEHLATLRHKGPLWQDARDMLAWPMTWSRLHGVAWVTTPALRVSTRSDYSLDRQDLTRVGQYTAVTTTRWTDNGFKTPAAMRAAHTTIVTALRGAFPRGARVIDLGAGDGRLLQQFEAHYHLRTMGVEISADASARRVSAGDWAQGDIADLQWADPAPDGILLMPGRLLELPAAQADAVRMACLRRPTTIVVYAYGDTMGPEGLEGLTRRAGLTAPVQMLAAHPSCAVGVLTRAGQGGVEACVEKNASGVYR